MKKQVQPSRVTTGGKFQTIRFVSGNKAVLSIDAKAFVEVFICEFDADGFGEKPTEKGVSHD